MEQMINYNKRPVSVDELNVIFRDNLERDTFILDYQFLDTDGNKEFYCQFIEKNIDSPDTKVKQNAIELSMAIDFFKLSFVEEMKKVVISRRHEGIKLACLDWLFCFYDKVPIDVYIEINKYAITLKNDFLKIQGILNLMLDNSDEGLKSKLRYVLKSSVSPAVFYRAVNYLDDIRIGRDLKTDLINEVKQAMSLNDCLSVAQRDELNHRIR